MKLYDNVFDISNDPPNDGEVWAMYFSHPTEGDKWEVNMGQDKRVCVANSEEQAVLIGRMIENGEMNIDNAHFMRARESAWEAIKLPLCGACGVTIPN